MCPANGGDCVAKKKTRPYYGTDSCRCCPGSDDGSSPADQELITPATALTEKERKKVKLFF